MNIPLMDVKRQHEKYSHEYESAVLNVLRSGNYIGGEEVVAFEQEFAVYMGARYSVSCGNGTDAIVLALRALNIGTGDEVITVAFTFFATGESIAAVGATPIFIDVCESSYCMNPSLIEEKITDKTKAILVVHMYGQSADMDEINKIAAKYNLKVVTDCAQATGTKYSRTRKNILGDIACFSFFPTKNLGADGDGGMVVTDDELLAIACRAYRTHGSGGDGLYIVKKNYEESGSCIPYDMPIGYDKYYNYVIGYNSRLDSLQAAILSKKLKHIDGFVDKRRKNAQIYNKILNNTSYKLPRDYGKSEHSYYIYAIQHQNAEKIIKELNNKGIMSKTYYPIPLHLQGAFWSFGYRKGYLPITEHLCKTTFAIPIFPELLDNEREYIISTLLDAERKFGKI